MTPEQIAASNAWPITEALKLIERVEKRSPSKKHVVFETGYGPSGLPHIGTFAEVFRTTLVRQAFQRLSDSPTELFAFSDDMDGLRKIPDNIPNPARYTEYLGRPLTDIPDPFGTHESYGQHMNARLMAFLDDFGFHYTFKSATECYRSGEFNATLLKVLERHDVIRDIVAPHLGPDRRATYSPILPVSPKSGRVLQVRLEETRVDSGTVVFKDEDGMLTEIPVIDGHCKMQWRTDWALRWTALDVDYEMSGKDLIDSVRLSSAICRALDGTPPEGFNYELFLDENGEKISKSRGNGLTIEQWLRYGTRESLRLFLYQSPRKAKRLHYDVIPRHIDDYYGFLEAYRNQDDEKRLSNPLWHIHDGAPPDESMPIAFSMLLNLASVVNAEEPEVLWGFIQNYTPDVTPQSAPTLDVLVNCAIAYYKDFVEPEKRYREATDQERAAFEDLASFLGNVDKEASPEELQNEIYEIGKKHRFTNLRDWFRSLYEVLLGQSQGPRFGSFVALYGIENTRDLIRKGLEGRRLTESTHAD